MGWGKWIQKKKQSFAERNLPRRPQIERSFVLLGGKDGSAAEAWGVDPSVVAADSIVYSVGVGDNIDFDADLINKFGAKVHAFDPTPESIQWVKQTRVPARFEFFPYGLADYDGIAKFFPHRNLDWVAHTMVKVEHTIPQAIELPVKKISTVMKSLGHSQIDLLKMNIEGGEYGVVADLLKENIKIKQLLVEFHHRFDQFSPRMTEKAIANLNAAGFKIFFMSPSREEYSFLKVQ